MRHIARVLAVLTLIAAVYAAGEMISLASQPVLDRYRSLLTVRQLPTRRPVRPPCAATDGLRAARRRVQIVATPDRLVFDFVLVLPAAHPCARAAFERELGDILEFVSSAFGTVSIGRHPLAAENFGPPTPYRSAGAERVSIHLEAHAAFDQFGFVRIERSLKEVPPANDEISIEWREGIRLRSVRLGDLQVPDVKTSSRMAARVAAPRSIPNALVWFEPAMAAALSREEPTSSTQQGFLQRLDDALFVNMIVSSLAFSVSLALPLLLAWAGFRRTAVASVDIGSLPEVTAVLLVFHFSVFTVQSLGWARSALSDAAQRVLDLLAHSSATFAWGGGTSAMAVVLGVLVPAVILQRLRSGPARESHLRQTVWMPFVAGLAAVLVGYAALADLDTWSEETRLTLAGGVGVLAATAFLALLGWLLAKRPVPALLVVACGLLVGGLVVLDRLLISGRQSAFWLGVTSLLGAFLLRSLVEVVLISGRDLALVPAWTARRDVRTLGIMILLLAAVPVDVATSGDSFSASRYSVENLAVFLARWVLPIWLVAVVALLYKRGRAGLDVDATSRAVGLLAAAAVLFSARITWLYLPVTFLLGWLALERVLVARPRGEGEALLATVTERQRTKLLAAALDLRAAEHALRGFRRKQLAAMANGEVDFATYDRERDARLEDVAKLRQQATWEGRKANDLILAVPPRSTAWRNGVHGAKYAALLASPWLAFGFAELLQAPARRTPHPLWDFSLDALLLLLKWVGVGFVFGYFFPYFRGSSGLAKGFYLFLGLTLPTLPLAAIWYTSPEHWQVVLFWFLQMFIHCILLGLFAFDYAALRRVGERDWRLLFELHGMPTLGISLSSLAVAIGTALTALLSDQIPNLMGAALRFVLPESPELPLPK